MKKQLLKALHTFSIMMLFTIGTANAQIVYTDILPDSTLYCQVPNGIVTKSYNLDLNNDANNDFILTAKEGGFGASSVGSASITPQANNAFITTSLNTAKKLVLGDTISSSQAWHDTTFQYLKKWNYLPGNPPILIDTGEWDTVVDGYIGLQLIHAGQTYYGWVRINVDVTYSSAIVDIKDYAYNSIPDQPILAGQTMTTAIIENSFVSAINIFPNPTSDELTADFSLDESADVQFELYDMVGSRIVIASKENYTAGQNRKQMNVEQVPSGIYQLAIKTDKSVISRKVIVQH